MLGHCRRIIQRPLPLGKLALGLEDLDGEEKCDFLACLVYFPYFPYILASFHWRHLPWALGVSSQTSLCPPGPHHSEYWRKKTLWYLQLEL